MNFNQIFYREVISSCFNISQQNTQPIEHLKFYPISPICENA